MKKFFSIILCLLFLGNTTFPAFADTAIEENNYFKIERKQVELKSRLSQYYVGYEYSIKNIYTSPVTISSIVLWNDSNGKAAYLSTQKTGKQVRGEVWQKGKKLALPTLSLSLVGAVVLMPFVTVKNSCADKMAQSEAKEFDKPYIQDVTVMSDKKLVFKTLTIKKHTPSLRVIYINPITDEKMTLILKQ